MKKIFASVLAVLVTAGSVYANEDAKSKATPPRRNRMSPPVYAPSMENAEQPGKMTPEQRAKFDAARRRRFEIMVLINASKIMPEKDRPAIHAQLMKLIEADFQAMIDMQKERIAAAEKDLERFRNELADREKNRHTLIKKELERLLSIPMPSGQRREKK